MNASTLTEKEQTTVPLEVRAALGIKPRQKMTWTVLKDGSAVVRPQPSGLRFFGVLKSKRTGASRAEERRETEESIARHAAQEGR